MTHHQRREQERQRRNARQSSGLWCSWRRWRKSLAKRARRLLQICEHFRCPGMQAYSSTWLFAAWPGRQQMKHICISHALQRHHLNWPWSLRCPETRCRAPCGRQHHAETGLSACVRRKCKLYRFDNDSGEWKERGVGQVRLLQSQENGKIRLLMRQEKTLKIRANHFGETNSQWSVHDVGSAHWAARMRSSSPRQQSKLWGDSGHRFLLLLLLLDLCGAVHKHKFELHYRWKMSWPLSAMLWDAVMPGTKLQEHSGSEKAWVYTTVDFADEEQKPELFCIRFASPESETPAARALPAACARNDLPIASASLHGCSLQGAKYCLCAVLLTADCHRHCRPWHWYMTDRQAFTIKVQILSQHCCAEGTMLPGRGEGIQAGVWEGHGT